jgi:hypothetical protein
MVWNDQFDRFSAPRKALSTAEIEALMREAGCPTCDSSAASAGAPDGGR